MAAKKLKGSALFSPEKRKEFASMGGKAAHASGNAHRWTSEEASAAGKKAAEKRWAAHRAAKAEGSK